MFCVVVFCELLFDDDFLLDDFLDDFDLSSSTVIQPLSIWSYFILLYDSKLPVCLHLANTSKVHFLCMSFYC